VADFKMLGYHDIVYFERGAKLDGDGTYPIGAVDQVFFEHMSIPLIEGRLPENSSEIVVPEEYMDVRERLKMEPLTVGDSVTLGIVPYIRNEVAQKNVEAEDAYAEEFGIDYQEFEKTYTVVGIMEDRSYSAEDPETFYFITMLTLSDGNEGEVLWHDLYAKTHFPRQAEGLAQADYGHKSYLFQNLLKIYGFALTEPPNLFVLFVAVLLIGVIMIASINPIRNAFSVSVEERTLQFGLLSSIGTTKKQVRRSVLFEAGIVSAIGIPLGILIGYGAVAVVFSFGRSRICQTYQTILSEMASKTITVNLPEMVLNWAVVMITAVTCAITVLISVRIPAKKATKVTPIEAIRKQNYLRVGAKTIRVSKFTGRVFGLPGVLAKKYYKTGRSKYRTTVVSISVGLVLFIGINYIGDALKMSLDFGYRTDYDLEYKVASSEDILTELEYARNVPGAKIAVALYEFGGQDTCVPFDSYTDGYRKCKQIQVTGESGGHKDTSTVYYLEDEYFSECLRRDGIDPTPYLTAQEPLAVTVEMNHRHWCGRDENGRIIWNEYYGSWLNVGGKLYLSTDAATDTLVLYDNRWNELPEIENGTMSSVMGEYKKTAMGETILKYSATRFLEEGRGEEVIMAAYLIKYDVDIDTGELITTYYTYDYETRKCGASVLEERKPATAIRVGGTLSTSPFGVGEKGTFALIMPMSQMPAERKTNESAVIRMDAADYYTCVSELKLREESEAGFGYDDKVEEKYDVYMMLDTFQFIINGLIIMISLVSAANVFNTITANIGLRRREIGMLRSIGMSGRDIDRMVGYECLSYGVKALGISLPISLTVCGVTYASNYRYYHTGVAFPWQTICFGSLMVFLIVFASAFYAVSKLRKDNPIDAIRMDNL